MQRQAVPLLVTEPPIVATGMEKHVAGNSSMVIKARRAGKVTYVDASRIEIGTDAVSYTHLRAHATVLDLVCRLLLEKTKIIIQHSFNWSRTRPRPPHTE